MAEASVQLPSPHYYCHVCNEDISPVLPEYTCPNCSGGFIEERSGDEDMVVDDPDDDALENPGLNSALSQILNMGPLQALLGGGRLNLLTGSDPNGTGSTPRRYNTRSTTAGQRTPGGATNAAAPGTGTPGQHQAVDQLGALGDILEALFNNLQNVRVNVDPTGAGGLVTTGEGPIQFQLHGNLGDYAWGNLELDRIITQLLNQMDSSGPPPLDKQLIRRLPTVNITQKHVDTNLQCMVCFEDYVLDEPVRKLPCAHLYHDQCIVPWLELHGTCPVCRCTIDVDGGEEPPGSNSSTDPSSQQPSSSGAEAC